MKSIINSIQNILGITALKSQAENLQASNAALLKEVITLREDNKGLTDQLDKVRDAIPTVRQIADLVADTVKDTGVDERAINRAVEDAINDQDWDEIVSEAMSSRQVGCAIDEAVESALDLQDRDEENTNESVANAIIEELCAGNRELIKAIAFEYDNYKAVQAAKTRDA